MNEQGGIGQQSEANKESGVERKKPAKKGARQGMMGERMERRRGIIILPLIYQKSGSRIVKINK